MPDRDVPVDWEISADESFRRIVSRGTAMARPEHGHSVHIEPGGLRPAATYWYRFRANNEVSAVGRTRTAPAGMAATSQLRFAFASCQHYQDGYFAAWRHLAEDDLDVVVHLGDYIYETEPLDDRARVHTGIDEPYSLIDYRNRLAQYRIDPDLQTAHASLPFIVTWDDHEVDNNWEGHLPQDPDLQSPQAFRRRQMAAFKAYYEHMPLRRSSIPHCRNLQLYRSFRYGDIASFFLLDGRQCRSDQPCEGWGDCADRLDPRLTMLGRTQEQWLAAGLLNSPTRWNVVGSGTVVGAFDYDPSPSTSVYNTDQWDGFPAARRRLLETFRRPSVHNPIVISGDSHANWINELKLDFGNPDSETVGIEFGGTSIATYKPWDRNEEILAAMDANPHLRMFNGYQRGYVRCVLGQDQWRTDFRVLPRSDVETITVPSRDIPIESTESWVVEAGRSAVEPA